MSNGHGVVPHGGIGLAAASISRSTGSPPSAGCATTYSRCFEVQALAGLVAVPDQAFGGEARPCRAPPRSTSATTSDPAQSGGIVGPHAEPRGVPRAAPRARRPRTARSRRVARVGDADRLAVHVVGVTVERARSP